MALFSECTDSYAQNLLDTADIVREAMFRHLRRYHFGESGLAQDRNFFHIDCLLLLGYDLRPLVRISLRGLGTDVQLQTGKCSCLVEGGFGCAMMPPPTRSSRYSPLSLQSLQRLHSDSSASSITSAASAETVATPRIPGLLPKVVTATCTPQHPPAEALATERSSRS